jgi:hypothetical protein
VAAGGVGQSGWGCSTFRWGQPATQLGFVGRSVECRSARPAEPTGSCCLRSLVRCCWSRRFAIQLARSGESAGLCCPRSLVRCWLGRLAARSARSAEPTGSWSLVLWCRSGQSVVRRVQPVPSSGGHLSEGCVVLRAWPVGLTQPGRSAFRQAKPGRGCSPPLSNRPVRSPPGWRRRRAADLRRAAQAFRQPVEPASSARMPPSPVETRWPAPCPLPRWFVWFPARLRTRCCCAWVADFRTAAHHRPAVRVGPC